MSSYLSEDSASHSTANSHSKQKCLEMQNKQLEQVLKDKQQSLNLQLRILRTQSKNSSKDPFLNVIQQLLQKQTQIRFFFTQRLLQRQVKIQQARQMTEIITNYEKRIADLRAVLINKQGDISAATFQFLRGNITRRENLQAVNSETLQKMALIKYAQQRKRLFVEIQALEFTLNEMQKNCQPKKRRSQLRQKSQGLKRQLTVKKIGQKKEFQAQNFQSGLLTKTWQKDLLTDKVVKLIQQQSAKYEEQLDLVEQLKLQLRQVEDLQLKNINKYRKSQQEWFKMLLKNDSVQNQPKGQGQYQLSFIKELQQEISNTISEAVNSELFSNIDTNKIESQGQISKSSKRISFATSSRDKKRKTLKQN